MASRISSTIKKRYNLFYATALKTWSVIITRDVIGIMVAPLTRSYAYATFAANIRSSTLNLDKVPSNAAIYVRHRNFERQCRHHSTGIFLNEFLGTPHLRKINIYSDQPDKLSTQTELILRKSSHLQSFEVIIGGS